jgi:hypothetical protein
MGGISVDAKTAPCSEIWAHIWSFDLRDAEVQSGLAKYVPVGELGLAWLGRELRSRAAPSAAAR